MHGVNRCDLRLRSPVAGLVDQIHAHVVAAVPGARQRARLDDGAVVGQVANAVAPRVVGHPAAASDADCQLPAPSAKLLPVTPMSDALEMPRFRVLQQQFHNVRQASRCAFKQQRGNTHPMMPPLFRLVMYTFRSAAVPFRSATFMLAFSAPKMSSGHLHLGQQVSFTRCLATY